MQLTTMHDVNQPKAVTIRPTPDDNKILSALRKKLGLSATSVIRQALRLLAEKEKVKV
jgi:hypothetical protein